MSITNWGIDTWSSGAKTTSLLDISTISLWEESPNNYWLWDDFPKIIVLQRDWDNAIISINNQIFTALWNSLLNQPCYFSIECEWKKSFFISWPSSNEWEILLFSEDWIISSAINSENPLLIAENSVYIITSLISWLPTNEIWYRALRVQNAKQDYIHTMLYWCTDGDGKIKIQDTQEYYSQLLWDWYYTNDGFLYDLVSLGEVITQLDLTWEIKITGIKHIDWRLFSWKYNEKKCEFYFSPAKNPSIPHLDLFWTIMFTDEDWYILDDRLNWLKIESLEWFKIKEWFEFIWFIDKKWKKNYLPSDVLKSNLWTESFDVNKIAYTFKTNNNIQWILPFATLDNQESPYHWYPLLDNTLLYWGGSYNTWFSWEIWVDYAFVLTENWVKKLLLTKWWKLVEININNRYEKPSSHSRNLEKREIIVWLHPTIWLIVLSDGSNSTSNYRYYAIKEEGSLIYIWWKDNIWLKIQDKRLIYEYQRYEYWRDNLSLDIILWENWLPLADFKNNHTFIVCENKWVKQILCLRVVNDSRQLAPHAKIAIPKWENVDTYFRNFIENNVVSIPWTNYLYIPWWSFYLRDSEVNWPFQFVWLDWKVSKAEKIENLPTLEIWWILYYLLSDSSSSIKKYYLYQLDKKTWNRLIEIESLDSLSIQNNFSCFIYNIWYKDNTSLIKTDCGSYIYPKVDNVLPWNIRLALTHEKWTPKNEYVVYDEANNKIICRLSTSHPPIKTHNPDEFIIISEDYMYIYNISTGKKRKKVVQKWLRLVINDTLTESYTIWWSDYSVLMLEGEPKKVSMNWNDYFEINKTWEFFGKKVVHLYNTKKQVILPYFDNDWDFTPVFEEVVWSLEYIVIQDWVLKYKFHHQNYNTSQDIRLCNITINESWEYIEFIGFKWRKENILTSLWHTSLRVWKSLNAFFRLCDNKYEVYFVEEEQNGLQQRKLPQIKIEHCSWDYITLNINWIPFELVFSTQHDSKDSTKTLSILEEYFKKILNSLWITPRNPCSETTNQVSTKARWVLERE